MNCFQIFVQENNIYFKRLDNDTIFYVTNSGIKETFFNGVPDWLYGGRYTLIWTKCLDILSALKSSLKAAYSVTMNIFRKKIFSF